MVYGDNYRQEKLQWKLPDHGMDVIRWSAILALIDKKDDITRRGRP
jgi:hypothetical protein